MMPKVFAAAALASVFLFPWPFAACLAVGISPFEPFVPVSVGLLADLLYRGSGMPWFTIAGGLLTLIAWFVRSRLKTGIIEE